MSTPATDRAAALIEKTRRAFEAFATGDPSLLSAALSEDVVWVFPGQSALAGTRRGIADVHAHWAAFGPALRGADFRHYLGDGERVVVLYTLDFDQGSTDGVDIVTWRDEKIVHFQVTLDTTLMDRVFGTAVPPG